MSSNYGHRHSKVSQLEHSTYEIQIYFLEKPKSFQPTGHSSLRPQIKLPPGHCRQNAQEPAGASPECGQRFTFEVNMAVASSSVDVHRFIVKKHRCSLGRKGKNWPHYLNEIPTLNWAEVWMETMVSSCGIIERSSSTHRATCVKTDVWWVKLMHPKLTLFSIFEI